MQLYVLNKIDSITVEELDLLDRVPHYVPVSAHHGWNFDELLEKVSPPAHRKSPAHGSLAPMFSPSP